MIAPHMATTLAVVLTDAIIDKQQLDIIIENAIDQTFNAITIDGDMSTNDTLIALAHQGLSRWLGRDQLCNHRGYKGTFLDDCSRW